MAPAPPSFHAVVERRAVDAEQARRLADIAVRQLQRGLDVAAFGGIEQAIEAERLPLTQAMHGSSDDGIAGRRSVERRLAGAAAGGDLVGRSSRVLGQRCAPTILPGCRVVRRMTMLRSSRTLPGKA
jgi:hypothetical protein